MSKKEKKYSKKMTAELPVEERPEFPFQVSEGHFVSDQHFQAILYTHMRETSEKLTDLTEAMTDLAEAMGQAILMWEKVGEALKALKEEKEPETNSENEEVPGLGE